MKKIILSLIPVALLGCGSGTTTSGGTVYYSASYSSNYLIESQNNNESQLLLSIIPNTGTYVYQAPLTMVSNNSYIFAQNGATGTVTFNNGNMGVSYQTSSSTWIDFATTNISNISLPSGTYNAVCDQTNLSACNITINNNNISITEFNSSGQPTVLCANKALQQVGSSNVYNPYLYSFTCGVNGGSSSGVWYAVPITINQVTGIMLSEFNPTINNNDDTTDEIAFPSSNSINPSGNYFYVYDGGSLGGVGVTNAQFSVAGLTNTVVGLCSGASCALVNNQIYNGIPKTGFDWYNVNNLNSYNLTGNDSMGIYQDSFEGFYF